MLNGLPNRTPFYYGWIIAGIGALGMILTSPGQTYSVSIFLEHFISDLGLSRSTASSLYTAGTLFGGLLLPFVGRRIDRYGVRKMMLVVSLLFGFACLYMGTVQNAGMLLVGFGLIRWLGQGSLYLVSANAINRWWVRRRGTMMGWAGVVSSILGLGAFPLLIDRLIPVLGWRGTYALLGGMVLMLMAPLGWLFLRDRPEAFGLEPDGAVWIRRRGDPPAGAIEDNWSTSEALRTWAFWVLALGAASISMLTTGLLFHMVSIFADHALSASAAAAVYAPISASAALFMLAGGFLIDRIPARYLMAAALSLQACALLMVRSLGGTTTAVVLYGITLGATQGISRSVSGVVWAKYFGREHLGSIAGWAQTAAVLGAAVGPLPLGIARDLLGDYDLALLLCATLPLLLAVAALFVRRPRRKIIADPAESFPPETVAQDGTESP